VRRLFAVACLGLAVAGLCARLSAAAFTGSTSISSNSVTVDKLANYFTVTPLNGAVASGGVDNLALDFGTVASARTFTSVFQVTNVSSASQTAFLTLSGVPQISTVAFSGGGTSITLAAGASTTVNVATSSTVAGRGSGTLRFGLSNVGWLYRDYSVKIDEAPEAPTAPAVVQRPAGRLDLSWTASTTVTNLAGYDVYRSTGGAYTKLTATPQTATTYSDTSTADGTTYTYKITAVSSGTPVLTSLDSSTVTATADATPPGTPTAVSLANGGGAGNAYVNAANASSISVSVTLPANSLTTDTVSISVSSGATTVSTTRAGTNGAGTITVSFNVASLGDGALTISASSTDFAGNAGSARTTTVTKDTVAPGAPTANYTDNNNANADVVSGSSEGNASITVTKVTAPTATYTTTAAAGGAYTVNVAATPGKPNQQVALTFTVTATDAAGNTSGATTLNVNDSK
jgi:fibronectin type 3 domain-containing protein